jgi:hypothetical protein
VALRILTVALPTRQRSLERATHREVTMRRSLAIATLACTFAVPAAAATLQVDGLLRSQAGGPVPDGTYVLFFALYEAADAQKPVWEEAQKQTPVLGGLFALGLGSATAIPEALLQSGKPLRLGVTVGSDGELPRVALRKVPGAYHADLAAGLQCSGCVGAGHLGTGAVEAKHVAFAYAGSQTKGGPADEAVSAKAAETAKLAEVANSAKVAANAEKAASADEAKSLACTGCIQPGHLHATVANAFLSTKGGTVDGKVALKQGLDLAGSALENANLAPSDPTKAPCTDKEAGRLAPNAAAGTLWYCTGKAWLKVKLCSGKCQDAGLVACGQPVPDDCGTLPCVPEKAASARLASATGRAASRQWVRKAIRRCRASRSSPPVRLPKTASTGWTPTDRAARSTSSKPAAT